MDKFIKFLNESPCMFHACDNLKNKLNENGFIEINESQKWDLKKGGKYYFSRNLSSLVAFTIPEDDNYSFNITAAHLDSPTFKLKPNFDFKKSNYNMLNVEVYGGPILNTWLDRPLNICGRVMYKQNDEIKTKLVSFDRGVAYIPNSSIHYNRQLNDGYKLNIQNELVPLIGINNDDLTESIAKMINVNKEDILGHDLYLALVDRASIVGLNNEFISSPQIDNLMCAYGLLEGLINSNNKKSVNVCVLFDQEEVGSRSRAGADSRLLSDTLKRISYAMGKSKEEHLIALASSYIVSADNGHAINPNYPNQIDPTSSVNLNEGLIIKSAARGSYSTDGFTLAYFKDICKEAGAKYQLNANRSDIAGGSTLGTISLNNVSIASIDIGLAQMAMHSANELAGAYDLMELVKAITCFYTKKLTITNDCNIKVE